MSRLLKLILVFVMIPYLSRGQELLSHAGYQSAMIRNPGMTGIEGDGKVRLSYINYYPGNNLDLHTAVISYDSYFPFLHGGAGFYLSDNYLGGVINDLRGGISYSYLFRAGRNLFFSAGLSASIIHRGYDYSGVILPDQIDPLAGAVFPSGEILPEAGRSVLDIGTGFLVITGRILGGIAVNHLARPDIYKSEFGDGSPGRCLLLHFTGDIGLSEDKNYHLRPVAKLEVQKGYLSAGGGAVFEANHLALNSIVFLDNQHNLDMQTGFSVFFSGMILNYSYYFNIASGDNLLPVSVMHQAGIAISLNNVDKRKTVKTINFPKL